MSADILSALLGALAGAPDLPRAACRNQARQFDGETPKDIALAVITCQTLCPELARCEAWAASQPRRRLCGVIAGEYYPHKPPRPLKKAS
jgi:hypothetical protein